MTLHMEKIPEACPICGEELKFTKEEAVAHSSGRGPRVISCPNCNFKVQLPYSNAEDDEELMKREKENELNEYAVAEHENVPSEDAMSAYNG